MQANSAKRYLPLENHNLFFSVSLGSLLLLAAPLLLQPGAVLRFPLLHLLQLLLPPALLILQLTARWLQFPSRVPSTRHRAHVQTEDTDTEFSTKCQARKHCWKRVKLAHLTVLQIQSAKRCLTAPELLFTNHGSNKEFL